jgi:hydroxymethylbilane synthase
VRGNVETRLRKLDEGEFDAIALAAAGLMRLGMSERISVSLPTDMVLPAVAQGALILESRTDDQATRSLVAVLDDPNSRATVLAERAFLRRLEGGCQVPIAAHAVYEGGTAILLRGLVSSLDGTKVIRGEKIGTFNDPETIGLELAEELLGLGAAAILDEIQACS